MGLEAQGCALGIDIGGTTTRVGLIGSNGCVMERSDLPTSEFGSAGPLIARLGTEIGELGARAGDADPNNWPVGIAVPGLLDERRHRVRRCVNVPWLEGALVAQIAAQEFEAPVRMVTDAQAATWGEFLARGRTPDRFVHVRVGTGVALGVIEHGSLVNLDSGRTGHREELIVDRTDQARACLCGLRGCLETVASGAMLAERMSSTICDGPRDVKSIGRGVRQSDNKPRPRGESNNAILLKETAGWIGLALENVASRWKPKCIVLGGGVIEAYPTLFAYILDLWDSVSPGGRPVPTLEPARLGDDAGIVGAGRMALDQTAR